MSTAQKSSTVEIDRISFCFPAQLSLLSGPAVRQGMLKNSADSSFLQTTSFNNLVTADCCVLHTLAQTLPLHQTGWQIDGEEIQKTGESPVFWISSPSICHPVWFCSSIIPGVPFSITRTVNHHHPWCQIFHHQNCQSYQCSQMSLCRASGVEEDFSIADYYPILFLDFSTFFNYNFLTTEKFKLLLKSKSKSEHLKIV